MRYGDLKSKDIMAQTPSDIAVEPSSVADIVTEHRRRFSEGREIVETQVRLMSS